MAHLLGRDFNKAVLNHYRLNKKLSYPLPSQHLKFISNQKVNVFFLVEVVFLLLQFQTTGKWPFLDT